MSCLDELMTGPIIFYSLPRRPFFVDFSFVMCSYLIFYGLFERFTCLSTLYMSIFLVYCDYYSYLLLVFSFTFRVMSR